MPKVFITEKILQDTAEAIRYVDGSLTGITPSDFAERIRVLKYYNSPWLNFTMPEGGTVTLTKTGTPTEVTLEYSLDNGITWTEWVESDNVRTLVLDEWQTMHVRNTSETSTRFSTSDSSYYQFAFTDDIYAGGNINSLLCKNPSNANLRTNCFVYLFRNCSNLITPPKLPSITLVSYCYSNMFRDSGIIAFPELPATTSETACYIQLTRGTNIQEANVNLLSTSSFSLAYLFQDCSQLNKITVKFTNIANNALYNWVSGVSATGDFYCPAELTIPTGTSGIPSGWTRHNIDGDKYLNFTMPDGGTITLTKNGTPTEVTLEYLIEGAPNWVTWTETDNVRSLTLSAGGKVYIRNTSETSTGFSTDSSDYYKFAFTDDAYVGGNTNSLLCKNPQNATITSFCYANLFRDCTSLMMSDTFALPSTTLAGYCYYCMFRDCTSLTMSDTFVLPSTTIADACYYYMFYGCTSLTMNGTFTLAATTLKGSCYYSMFRGCISLTMSDAFTLPATTLKSNCYGSMFRDCTSLTMSDTFALPADTMTTNCYDSMFYGCISLTMNDMFTLPATTLADACYYSMFFGCTSLTMNDVFTLPVTTLAAYCYAYMFRDCTSLTMNSTFALPATTLKNYCYAYMFFGCTSLTINDTFTLPATMMVTNCYANMFYNCTNINLIRTSMTDVSASNCLSSWLYHVSATGDFYCPAELTIPTGASGIPSGWTRHNIDGDKYLNFTMPDGGTITLTKNGSPTEVTLEYLIEGEPNWVTWTETDNVRSLALSAGGKVYIRNTSETSTGFSTNNLNKYTFAFTKNTYAGGNTNSLLCKNSANAVITDGCLRNLFSEQTTLITAPNLPALVLRRYCYAQMFLGCTNLISPPIIGATTQAEAACWKMFYQCSSLEESPELKTEVLAKQCYQEMFYGCTKLKKLTTLMTNISATYCLSNWLVSTAATGDFYCHSELTIPTNGNGIPNGWTRHDLPT